MRKDFQAGSRKGDRLESSEERQSLTPGQGNWAGRRAGARQLEAVADS